MSRVTAAFVCALCDPDNPRPASIMCSNNCGRYICAAHAMPRKGPGSAMVCLSCAEALGLIEKPRPRPAPDVRPLIEIPPETKAEPVVAAPAAATPITPPPAPPIEAVPAQPITQPVEPINVSAPSEQATVITPKVTPPPAKEPVVIDYGVPAEQQTTARRTTEPEPAPQSATSETIVSQRGSTLQIPKVAPTLGKPPAPITKPRKALRVSSAAGNNIDWVTIGMIAGTIVLGIIGFVLVLAALSG